MMRNRLALLSALLIGGHAWAAEPASGSLSLDNPEISFVSGPSLVSDPATGNCPDSPQCDRFDLSVELPADFATTNPSATIKIYLTAALPAEDYDLFLLDDSGAQINNSGNAPPSAETIIAPAGGGSTQFRVEVLPFLVAGGSANVTISLQVPTETGGGGEPPTLASGLPPRFHYFQSPNGVANGAGEPTLGYNPASGNAMFVAGLEVDRVSFAENTGAVDAAGNPLPESCEPTWVHTPYELNVNTLDPILETEQSVGRTFQSQLSGANSIFSFTDDDGDTWIPAQIGPPNGGADHQSVGTGPYSENYLGLANPDGYAVYYCSQSIGAAFCARSDDGGLSFGPGIPIYSPTLDCGGDIGALHGHVQVANDGTVYVPFGSCGDQQAVSVSEDSGQTWSVKIVPETSGGDDPGVGVANDGSVYFCYVNDQDYQPRVAVSRDKGDTWENYRELGLEHDIEYAVFPTAVAGDGDRAACAWLGSDDPSPGATASNSDYQGIWYPYVSMTYDGGESWHTVNVSPKDPVQGAGGICLSGTTCGSNRNLLDFNDIVMDDKGRVLFGHADGCIGTCVGNPLKNTFSDNGVIARQSGGRSLLSAFDAELQATRFNGNTPLAPAAACIRSELSTRTTIEADLRWNAPDDGGASILAYEVYRATDPAGPYLMVGMTDGRERFVDGSTDPAVENYYYKVVAINSTGNSGDSNVIALPVAEIEEVDTCLLPGEIIALDAIGDGAADDTDIEYLAVAEPPELAGFFALTYKLVNFTAGTPPVSAFYPLLFQDLREANRYIALDVTTGLPRHVYGTFVDEAAGVLVFNEEGTLDPRSSVGSDGTIVHVVPAEFFGTPAPGEVITGFDARARVGAPSAPSRDTAGPGGYVVRGSVDCSTSRSDELTLARLQASRTGGEAPLEIIFTLGGQAAGDASLDEFSISFGDGSTRSGDFAGQASVTQRYTYTQAGAYSVRLTVTDSAGTTSANRAEKMIEVRQAGEAPSTGGGETGGNSARKPGGGALSPQWLLLLGLLGLGLGMNRRQRRM